MIAIFSRSLPQLQALSAIESSISLTHCQIQYNYRIIRMGRQKEAGSFRSFVAGGFGGVCCVVSGQPFDTVKVGYPRWHAHDKDVFRTNVHI